MQETSGFMHGDRPLPAGAGHLMHAIGTQAMMADEVWLSHFLGSVIAQPDASWFMGSYDPRTRCNVTDDGIAMVRVHGLLVNRGPWLGSIWGMTSYEGLGEQLKRCAADSSIKQIVLDIDSGGGMVAGLWDLMPALAQIREKKPVTAIANAFCASAAYAIGCAADKLYVNRSSMTGSIGVIRPHLDYSGAMEKHGVRATMFKAGRFKDAGSSMVPLTREAADYIQTSVDQNYDQFVAHVAQHRRIDPQAVRDTEARVYGAEDTCALGLADGIMGLDELVDHLRSPRNTSSSPGRSRPSPPSSGGHMTTQAAAPNYSAADLELLSNSIAASLKARPLEEKVSKAEAERMAEDAADKAAAEARASERARIGAITGHESAKGREGAALKMALTTDLSVDQAAGLLAEMPAASQAKPETALSSAMRDPKNSAGIRPDAAAAAGATGASARPSLADRAKGFKAQGRRSGDDD